MFEKIIKGDLRIKKGDIVSHIGKIEGSLIVESGNHNFNKLKATIQEIIEITKGQYNSDILQNFFKEAK